MYYLCVRIKEIIYKYISIMLMYKIYSAYR